MIKLLLFALSFLFTVFLRNVSAVGAVWTGLIGAVWLGAVLLLVRRLISLWRPARPRKVSLWLVAGLVELVMGLVSFWANVIFLVWWAKPSRFSGLDPAHPYLAFILTEIAAGFNVYGQGYGTVVPDTTDALVVVLSALMTLSGRTVVFGVVVIISATVKFGLL